VPNKHLRKVHYRYLQFWDKQILGRWPARLSEEELDQKHAALIESWRGIIDDAKHHLSNDPGMSASVLNQFIDDHTGGGVFQQYYHTRDISCPVIGAGRPAKFEGSNAELSIFVLSKVIDVMESQWFPDRSRKSL